MAEKTSLATYFRRFWNYAKENPWTAALIIMGAVIGVAAIVTATVFTGGAVAGLIAAGAGATFLGLSIGTCFGTAAGLLLSSWFCFNTVKGRLDKINTEMAAEEKLVSSPVRKLRKHNFSLLNLPLFDPDLAQLLLALCLAHPLKNQNQKLKSQRQHLLWAAAKRKLSNRQSYFNLTLILTAAIFIRRFTFFV